MSIDVVDVMSVPARGDPLAAVRGVDIPARMVERECDVLVLGGGTGGVAAALAATRHGMRTIVLEETDWIGGQLTTQGVAALDEHEHIESFGGTRTYSALREGIRDHYRHTYPEVRDVPELNPGRCWVTHLAFEPRVALAVLWGMLGDPGIMTPATVDLRMKAVAAEVAGDEVRSVVAINLASGACIRYSCKLLIDATELGDGLALCGAEYAVGAETRSTTDEPHARTSPPCPDCVQSFTYPAALRLARQSDRGDARSVAQPPGYKDFLDRQPYSLRIHVTGGEIYSETSGWLEYDLFDRLPGTKGGLWDYRRLVARDYLGPPATNDISIINWPGNDYRDQSLLTIEPREQAVALQAAKWVSQGFVHWLRTDGPDRSEVGRARLSFAPDVYGTDDGLSKHPYIRESRRLVSMRQIREQDVAPDVQTGPAAARPRDSVGIGWYPIDIHSAHPDEVAVSLITKPFHIPLAALIPVRVRNLLAGAKNLGTSHIANGCFRLHPVEWNVGEAAGIAAALAVSRGDAVQALENDEALLRELQATLLSDGVPLDWVLDIGTSHPSFAAVQGAALNGEFDPRAVGLEARRLSPTQQRKLGIG